MSEPQPERWEIALSDAGLYFRNLSEVGERTLSFLRRIDDIRTTLERDGRWEESDEWRIATVGTVSIELLPHGRFRALADYHGTFVADFATFAESYEAVRVLSHLQAQLMYAVGWASWADQGRSTESAPPRERREEKEGYAYLYRLSREARADGLGLASVIGPALDKSDAFADEAAYGDLVAARSFRRVSRRWGDDDSEVPVIELEVRSRSFSMRAESPTVDRAAEFAGIYLRLQHDLQRALEWAWL